MAWKLLLYAALESTLLKYKQGLVISPTILLVRLWELYR